MDSTFPFNPPFLTKQRDLPPQEPEVDLAQGTLLRWESSNKFYKRSAVVIKDGQVLQVKVRSIEGNSNERTLFKNFNDWYDSLPAGIIHHEEPRTAIEKRLDEPYDAVSDYELLRAIASRWRISARGMLRFSLNGLLAVYNKAVIVKKDSHLLDKLVELKATMAKNTPAQNDYKAPHISYVWGKKNIFLVKNGVKVLAAPMHHSYNMEAIVCDGKIATSFVDLGVDMAVNGRPIIWILYRKRNICLNI